MQNTQSQEVPVSSKKARDIKRRIHFLFMNDYMESLRTYRECVLQKYNLSVEDKFKIINYFNSALSIEEDDTYTSSLTRQE